jgi:hypothetical protein
MVVSFSAWCEIWAHLLWGLCLCMCAALYRPQGTPESSNCPELCSYCCSACLPGHPPHPFVLQQRLKVLRPLSEPGTFCTTLWRPVKGVLFYGPPGTGVPLCVDCLNCAGRGENPSSLNRGEDQGQVCVHFRDILLCYPHLTVRLLTLLLQARQCWPRRLLLRAAATSSTSLPAAS